jgi:predicted amidohydrolase
MVNLFFVQVNLKLGDIRENTGKVFYYLNQARDGIVLVPEMFSCGFDNNNLGKHAEHSGKIFKQLEKISLENNLVISGTLPETTNGTVYNNGFIIDRGNLVYKRGKYKLFKFTDEHKYFSRGENKFDAVESSLGKLGLIICFELRFGEILSELRKRGPEIILVPAQWGKKRTNHFKTLLKAAAIQTQSYVISSNTVGKIDIEYAGHSSIYDPWGEELICAMEKEGIFNMEIDINKVNEIKKFLPMD